MKFQSLFVFAVLTAAGCASDDVKFIDFNKTGGLASVSQTLHIDPDGSAVRNRGGADEALTLSAETMADLRAKVSAANLPGLADTYTSNTADAFTYEVTAKLGSDRYTVVTADDADAPDAFQSLTAALNELLIQD